MIRARLYKCCFFNSIFFHRYFLLVFSRIISQLQTALKTKELILEQTEEEKRDIAKDVKMPLEARIKQMERQIEAKDREIQVSKHWHLMPQKSEGPKMKI